MIRIDVIIPALNEVGSVARVVRALRQPPVRTVLVVDNASTDGTAAAARRRCAGGGRAAARLRRGLTRAGDEPRDEPLTTAAFTLHPRVALAI